MNANELADALQETEPYYSTDYKLFDQAATMLRNQLAEIERLKALCIFYIDDEWSGTSSYQAKIDEVNNERK
jgi:hypothetical protein